MATGSFKAPQVTNIDLTTPLNLADYIYQPGTRIWSIFLASGPAGLTILMSFGQRSPFPVQVGQSYTFDTSDCPVPMDAGLSFQTNVAAAGQFLTVVVGVEDGGVGVTT